MGDFTVLHQMIAEAQEAKEERRKRQEEIEKALMNGPNVERMEAWALMMARDAFMESDHPRDEKGRFTEKGMTKENGTISKGTTYGNIGRTTRTYHTKRKTIWLPAREYAMVIHVLNTDLTRAERRKRIIQKPIRDHIYTVEIYGYDNYRIVGKKEIP